MPRLRAGLMRMAALLVLAGTAALPPALAASPAPATADEPPADLALVTLSLGPDRDPARWLTRRDRIAEALRAADPDAIALLDVQEARDLPNQAAWLARELGYAWHFVTTDPPSHPQRRGNALLTRAPAMERGETLLHPVEDQRAAGLVRILAGGRPLNLYLVQLHAGAGEDGSSGFNGSNDSSGSDDPSNSGNGSQLRAGQVHDLLAWIHATADGLPCVVAGVFNAPGGAPELAPLAQDFEDAWAELHAPLGGDAATSAASARVFLSRHGTAVGGLLAVDAVPLAITGEVDGDGISGGLQVRLRWRDGDTAPPAG